jgi:hypothetical protein
LGGKRNWMTFCLGPDCGTNCAQEPIEPRAVESRRPDRRCPPAGERNPGSGCCPDRREANTPTGIPSCEVRERPDLGE